MYICIEGLIGGVMYICIDGLIDACGVHMHRSYRCM